MKEIEEKLKELSNCVYILIVCSVLALLGLLTIIIPADSNFKSSNRIEDKLIVINAELGALNNYIRSTRNSVNVEMLLNDCEKLKRENEILLDKVQFYREKYEKMP